MEIFSRIAEHGHEQVVFCHEESCGLRAIIAIHDTTLGPALGGVRMWEYASDEEALLDVLRLARGMTYKASVAGLNLGGGKAVIVGDPKRQKSEALFRAFGRFARRSSARSAVSWTRSAAATLPPRTSARASRTWSGSPPRRST